MIRIMYGVNSPASAMPAAVPIEFKMQTKSVPNITSGPRGKMP